MDVPEQGQQHRVRRPGLSAALGGARARRPLGLFFMRRVAKPIVRRLGGARRDLSSQPRAHDHPATASCANDRSQGVSRRHTGPGGPKSGPRQIATRRALSSASSRSGGKRPREHRGERHCHSCVRNPCLRILPVAVLGMVSTSLTVLGTWRPAGVCGTRVARLTWGLSGWGCAGPGWWASYRIRGPCKSVFARAFCVGDQVGDAGQLVGKPSRRASTWSMTSSAPPPIEASRESRKKRDVQVSSM